MNISLQPRNLLPILLISLLLIGCVSAHSDEPSISAAQTLRCSPTSEARPRNADGASIALSGGGYRAMLFHVGSLWRLNELGVLEKADMISSVSGGSILAGILAINWKNLIFDEKGRASPFEDVVAKPAIKLASNGIDVSAITLGLLPGLSASRQLEEFYTDQVFGSEMLVNLPKHPKFIFNATNLQTGQVWRFTRNCIGDDAIGYASPDEITLATAVAASSSYPPFISPLILDLGERIWKAEKWSPVTRPQDIRLYESLSEEISRGEKNQDQYRNLIYLTDGGVADNLGVSSIMDYAKEIFVSDGGAGLNITNFVKTGPISEVTRLIDIVYSQPSELRSKILIDLFTTGKSLARLQGMSIYGNTPYIDGVIASIKGPVYRHLEEDHIGNILNECFDIKEARDLAELPTRLDDLDDRTAKRIINWGYFVTDNAMPFLARMWWRPKEPTGYKLSSELPYPAVGFGDSSARCIERAGRP